MLFLTPRYYSVLPANVSALETISLSLSLTRFPPPSSSLSADFSSEAEAFDIRVTPLLRVGLVGGCFHRLVELIAERLKNSDVSEVDELLTRIKTFAAILLVCLSAFFQGVFTKPPMMSW